MTAPLTDAELVALDVIQRHAKTKPGSWDASGTGVHNWPDGEPQPDVLIEFLSGDPDTRDDAAYLAAAANAVPRLIAQVREERAKNERVLADFREVVDRSARACEERDRLCDALSEATALLKAARDEAVAMRCENHGLRAQLGTERDAIVGLIDSWAEQEDALANAGAATRGSVDHGQWAIRLRVLAERLRVVRQQDDEDAGIAPGVGPLEPPTTGAR